MGPDILNSYLLFYVIDKVSSREQRIIYSTRHPLPKAYFIWADTISIKYKVKTFRIDRVKATLTGQFLTIKYKKFTTTDRTDSDSMLIAYKSKKTEFTDFIFSVLNEINRISINNVMIFVPIPFFIGFFGLFRFSWRLVVLVAWIWTEELSL